MDFVNKFTEGENQQKESQQAEQGDHNDSQQNQAGGSRQQEGEGGFLSGLGNKLNSAAGGGKESEKNEDMLDKGSSFSLSFSRPIYLPYFTNWHSTNAAYNSKLTIL